MSSDASAPLLAIDTSTGTARVAVISSAGVVLASGALAAERHSANLLALCDQALTGLGLGVGDLRAIACGAGPGSFTGLRVGLAVAKGLALATDRPLVLISSLAALADDLGGVLADRPSGVVLWPCLDAGKGEIYAQPFGPSGDVWSALELEWRLPPAEVARRIGDASAGAPFVVGGPGAVRHAAAMQAVLGEGGVLQVEGPSAQAVGRRALIRLDRGERDDLERSVPTYGRPPDITMPRVPRPHPVKPE